MEIEENNNEQSGINDLGWTKVGAKKTNKKEEIVVPGLIIANKNLWFMKGGISLFAMAIKIQTNRLDFKMIKSLLL